MLLVTLFSLHHNILSIVPSVAFARLFFPAEAKVAMQIAQADTTEEFGGIVAPSTSGKLREVDLNETPVTQNKRLRSRVDALMKTGEVSTINLSILLNMLCQLLPENLVPMQPQILHIPKYCCCAQSTSLMRYLIWCSPVLSGGFLQWSWAVGTSRTARRCWTNSWRTTCRTGWTNSTSRGAPPMSRR